MLKDLPDPRHQSYITYPGVILLMTRILSSIFYISSMRKTSEEFNSAPLIENVWTLCGEEPSADELPYWETINRYLEKLDPDGLQETICRLCSRLIRSRAFENNRIRGRYWQVIIDGTQLYSTREELDGKCLYRIHKRGKPEEYRENYYYIVEAKLVLHPEVVVSIMTEFLGSEGGEESGKQDCERKGCMRLMERLKKAFPHLKICVCADSLYAYEGFFQECGKKHWKYIVRFKEGSIPSVAEEYHSLKKREKNCREKKVKEDIYWYDYVTGIDYNGYLINVVEYREEREREYRKGKRKGERKKETKEFLFLTDLPVRAKQVEEIVERGRMRWKIENEGFNTQKRQGYHLEHRYSKNYQGWRNHYYLIQIGHMIAQVMEGWKKIWEGICQGREQKHRRLLESFKQTRIKEYEEEIRKKCQIRFE